MALSLNGDNFIKFDIFERISLTSDDKPFKLSGESQLYADVDFLERDNIVLCKGHLLLSVGYGNSEDSDYRYPIPVEISIPKDRVEAVKNLNLSVVSFELTRLNGTTLSLEGVVALSEDAVS